MWKMICVFVSSLCLFLLCSNHATAEVIVEENALVNSGFESNLYGWTYSGDVSVKGSYAGIYPTEGNFQAVLSPHGSAFSELSQNVKSETGFSLSLSFDYNLWSCATCSGSEGGDDFVVYLKGDDYISEILRVNTTDDSSPGATIQGWEQFEAVYEFDSAMDLWLVFELDNFKDPTQLSVAFLDNITTVITPISANPVPLPPALVLFGSALAGLTGMKASRRRSKAA